MKGRSSVSGRLSVRDSYDAQPIIATGAPTTFPDLVNTERLRFEGEVRAEHALSATQTLRGEYQHWDSSGDNLGVGEFELPERAFSEDTAGDIARLSAIGTIGRHFLNEVRLEYVDIRSGVDSLSNAVGINVPNAFRAGGAQRSGGRRDQEIEIAQTIDLISHPKHKVRAGFETELGWTRTDRFDNYVGVFTFASLGRTTRPARRSSSRGASAIRWSRTTGRSSAGSPTTRSSCAMACASASASATTSSRCSTMPTTSRRGRASRGRRRTGRRRPSRPAWACSTSGTSRGCTSRRCSSMARASAT